METKYCNTLVSSREDGKLAHTDNIYDKEIGQMQNIINKRFIDFMEKLGINISVNDKGQHIWTVGTSQYILTPYTEAAVVVNTEYDKPIITGFSYRNAVSNNGGKASVGSLTFTQRVTYTWNNGTQTFKTIDGNLDTEGLEVIYAISDILNNARVDEFGNVEADPSTVINSKVICSITPQIIINDTTSFNRSVFAEVSQAGATCTFEGGGTTYTKDNVESNGTNFTVILNKSMGVNIAEVNDDSDGVTAFKEKDDSINIEVFENEIAAPRTMHVNIVTNVGTFVVTINQKAAREATITDTIYGTPVIKQFAYSGNIGNNGDVAATVSTLTFEQPVTYIWSKGDPTYDTLQGNLGTADATFSFTIINPQNGAYVSNSKDNPGSVTALPSISATEEIIGTVTPQVTWHNMPSNNSSVTAVVKQDAAIVKFTSNNSKTYNKTGILYGGETFNINITKSSGVEIGTPTVSPASAATAIFENGAIRVVVNANPNTTQRNITVTIPTNIGNLTINGVQEALVIQKYFYIGQTTNTLSGFAALSNNEIVALATKTNVNSGVKGTGTIAGISVSNHYKHHIAITNSIFFVLIPSDVNLAAAYFDGEGDSFDTPYSNEEVANTSIWRATHTAVTIDGVSYNVYGYRDPNMAGNYMDVYVN